MRLLLDTQTFIWFVENEARLPNLIKMQIEDANNDIHLSNGEKVTSAVTRKKYTKDGRLTGNSICLSCVQENFRKPPQSTKGKLSIK